jgi:hypothetical protein
VAVLGLVGSLSDIVGGGCCEARCWTSELVGGNGGVDGVWDEGGKVVERGWGGFM